MRKWISIFLLIILAIAASLWMVMLRAGRTGESSIEAWVGGELKSIVNAGGRFRLDFDAIDYQAPNRVVLDHLKLSLADASPETAPLIQINRGTVDLAEIPRPGRPIVIASILLNSPTLHIESFIAAAHENSTTRSTTRPTLSAILTLRRVEIQDGTITYDDGKGSPLAWSALNAKLDLEPIETDWHRAKIAIDQSPLIKTSLSAEINLDGVIARNIDLNTSIDLNESAALKFFTPPLQRFLAKHEIRGHANVTASGSVNALHPDLTRVVASAELTDGNYSLGAYHIPIERAQTSARIEGEKLFLEEGKVQTLGGTVRFNATATLDRERRINMQVITNGLHLDQLLATRDDTDKSSLTGLVDSDIRIDSTMRELAKVFRNETVGAAWGTGYVKVSEGRLLRLPVIGKVIEATRQVTGFFTGGGVDHDSLEAQFKLIDKIVDISDLLYTGQVVGLRGKGRIAFNGELDLIVNAGPLERLQESLGAFGKLWGQLTDKLLSYSVKGTVKEPVVRPSLGSG